MRYQISPQVTLDEADAILAEFGSKVTEDKESPKQGQNVSSEEMDTGGNEEEDAEMPDLQDFAIPEVKKWFDPPATEWWPLSRVGTVITE